MRMSETGDYRDVEQVVVAVDGVEETWSLEFRSRPDSWWTLILTGSGGASWIGAGQGLWTAFLELRRQIDPLSYKLCCAGRGSTPTCVTGDGRVRTWLTFWAGGRCQGFGIRSFSWRTHRPARSAQLRSSRRGTTGGWQHPGGRRSCPATSLDDRCGDR